MPNMKKLNGVALVAPAPGPTPAAVAASVHKLPSLELGMRGLARLNAQRDELRDRQRALTAEHIGETDGGDAGHMINRIAKEAEAIEAQCQTLRIELAPLLRAYAAEVSEAVAPVRCAAAERALAALADLRSQLATLAECDDISSSLCGDVSALALQCRAAVLGLGFTENVARRALERGAT